MIEADPGTSDPLGGASGSFVLMRHGQTEWNREGRIMGRLPIPLNAEGVAQCRGAVHLLRCLDVRRVETSPLVRARQTAEIVARELQLAIDSDEGLSEVDFGEWSGRAYAEVLGTEEYRRYAADPLHCPPPRGESLIAVQRRGLGALRRALERSDGQVVLIVSHGDLIRSVLCHLLACPLGEYRRIGVDNCAATAVAVVDGMVHVRFMNALPDVGRLWSASTRR